MAREAHAERARRRKKVPPAVREEKQPSPFPGRAFWAGPRAVFSGQIKDLGLTATVCGITICIYIDILIHLSI